MFGLLSQLDLIIILATPNRQRVMPHLRVMPCLFSEVRKFDEKKLSVQFKEFENEIFWFILF